MFHIEFLVRDGNLADVLTRLSGKTLELQVRPVEVKAQAPKKIALTTPIQETGKRTKKQRAKKTGLTMREVMLNMPSTFGVPDIVRVGGFSKNSVYGMASKLTKDGLLERVGKGSWKPSRSVTASAPQSLTTPTLEERQVG